MVIVPEPLASKSARMDILAPPVFEERFSTAPALRTILFAAASVRSVFVLPAVVTLLTTVILPAWVPVLPVVMVTEVPPSKAATIVAGAMVASGVEGSKTPELRVPVPPVTILTFCGSKSHSPALPKEAEALADPNA